jgi:hypothetical protein
VPCRGHFTMTGKFVKRAQLVTPRNGPLGRRLSKGGPSTFEKFMAADGID